GGSICIVGDEPYAPYQRPPLSKKFLTERDSVDSLALRAATFWRDHHVCLVLGTAVAKVELRQERILLQNGREIAYRTLVFATGTRAPTPPLGGLTLPTVSPGKKIAGGRGLRPASARARRIAIIGGGYIGLEVAASMRGEGRDVTIIETQERVMKRVTGECVSAFFHEMHLRRGVDIRLGAKLAVIEQRADSLLLHVEPEETLAADVVLIATGTR